VDGDAEQFGIDGPLEPNDAGIGQFDLQLPSGAGIEDRDRQEGGSRGTVHLGHRPGRGPLRTEWEGSWCLAEAAFPGVEGHRADAEPTAELGDRQAALLLTLDLAAPPLAPRLATCRRSESDHGRSPGDEKQGSGIETTIGAKDGSAERLHRESYPYRAGRSRADHYPGLAHSGRPYAAESEGRLWDWSRVTAHLSTYVVTRRVDPRGCVSLYNRGRYVGKAHRGRAVWVMFDPEASEWVFADSRGHYLSRKPADELSPERVLALDVTRRVIRDK
jgi:hypothetical protein